MFIVIEEYIQRLSCKYDVIGVFNSECEAQILAQHKKDTEGAYQFRHGYYYKCFVEEVDTDFLVLPDSKIYIIIKSGIYTSGPTRQTLTEWSSTDRADFESVVGIWDNKEKMQEEFDALLEEDKDGFYFCFEYVKGDRCEQTNSF